MRPLCVLLAVALASLLEVPGMDACSFPHYLTRRPRWESQIFLNRRRTDVYYKFHERTLEMVDLTTHNSDSSFQECMMEMPGQKYILESKGEVTHYTCLQFSLKSDQVVQVRKSQAASELDAVALCENAALTMDPWPLVWPKVGDTYHACPLNGGYDFSITDHVLSESFCDNASLKPRLESECMAGEGISLDFRNFECRGRLEMEVQQNLVCLGTWTEHGHSYTVLTDNDELWPKLWMLRFPVRHGPEFKAQLFNDIVVDSTLTHSENYFELNLRQALYPSLCENEAFPCNDCEGPNNYYCQKSCHRCDALQDVTSCDFDLPSRGEWVEVSHHGHRDLTVTASMIYADDLLPLQCFDLHTEAWFEDKNYKSLATLFKNGCKPRYTCVEFERLSSSILLYRLSQNLVWPHTLVLTGQDVCGEAQFRDDPSPLESEFRSQHLKALVRKSTLNRPRPTVDCELDGKFLMNVMYENGARNCSGYLDTCQSSHSFTLQTGTSCTGTVVTETHRCLGSFSLKDEDVRLVMTDKVEGDGESYCWAFHKDDWDPVHRVYLLYASDCHKDIGRQIKYYGYRGHIAEFTLTKGPGYLGSFPCHHQFPPSEDHTPKSPHSVHISSTHPSSSSTPHGRSEGTLAGHMVPTSAIYHEPSQKPTFTALPDSTPGKEVKTHSPTPSPSTAKTNTEVKTHTPSTAQPPSEKSTAPSSRSSTSTQEPADIVQGSKKDQGTAFDPNRAEPPIARPVARASTGSGAAKIAGHLLMLAITMVTITMI